MGEGRALGEDDKKKKPYMQTFDPRVFLKCHPGLVSKEAPIFSPFVSHQLQY